MLIRIRLYKCHDFDLLWYGSQSYVDLYKVIFACLCAYVRKIPYSLPEVTNPLVTETVSKDKRIGINIDEQKDADIVAWINTIEPQSRGVVIKNILRLFLPKSAINGAIYNIINSHMKFDMPGESHANTASGPAYTQPVQTYQPAPAAYPSQAAAPAPQSYVKPVVTPQSTTPVQAQPAPVQPVVHKPAQTPVKPQPAPSASTTAKEPAAAPVDAFDMFESLMG